MLRRLDPRGKTIGELVVPYLAALVTVILGLTVWQTIENREFAHDLRASQIENCQTSPVRRVLIEGLEEEKVSPADRRVREAFPDLPEAIRERLIREADEKIDTRIGRLVNIDCRARYSH